MGLDQYYHRKVVNKGEIMKKLWIVSLVVSLVALLHLAAIAGGGPGSGFNVDLNDPNYSNGSFAYANFSNELDQPFFTGIYNETSTWTAISKPGGVSGRWISVNNNWLFSQTWSIEGYIWSGLQETRNQFTASLICGNSMGYFWSVKLQNPNGSIIDQWQFNSVGDEYRSYTLDTINLPLASWKNGYKFTVMVSDNPLPVPEPASFWALVGGIVPLGFVLRRWKH